MAKEFPVGLPLHQIPKDKAYRKLIVPPPGCYFIVADVDSQETHLMAEISEDPALLDVYYNNLDPHSLTASRIACEPYDSVVAGVKAEDPRYVKIRKGGKVTNLSKNFRCGPRTIYNNAHVNWSMNDFTLEEAKAGSDAWLSLYREVPKYWDKAIARAKHYGYAETLAGRRFGIHLWDRANAWKSESSAIMTPIQGSGADMKYLAIAIMRRRFPELTYWGEIHDEIIHIVRCMYPRSRSGMLYGNPGDTLKPKCRKIKEVLDNLPFEKAWGWKPKIPFTWSVGYGRSWGDIKDV